VILEIPRRDRTASLDFGENGVEKRVRNPRLPFVVTPPSNAGLVSLRPVSGERCRGENAALLREVLEGVAGKEMLPEVTAGNVLRPSHHDEIRIRPDGVQRVDLNAAETVEHRAGSASASAARSGEPEMRDETSPRVIAGERDGWGHELMNDTRNRRVADARAADGVERRPQGRSMFHTW